MKSFPFPPPEGLALQADGKFLVVATFEQAWPHGWLITRVTAGGRIDRAFGENGRVTTKLAFGPDEAGPAGIGLQGSKFVVTGGAPYGSSGNRYSFTAARYRPGGGLDSTFGTNGITKVGFYGYFGTGQNLAYGRAMVMQPDGKIVMAGEACANCLGLDEDVAFALVRLTQNGFPDDTFGTDGRVATDLFPGQNEILWDVEVDPEGRIVAAGAVYGSGNGESDQLVRYTPEGDLDTTFDDDGFRTINGSNIALQPDGKILAAGAVPDGRGGTAFSVVRYNEDGSVDTTFGTEGEAVTDFTAGADSASDIAIQASGKIVVVGRAAGRGERFALARYTAEGDPDPSFGGGDGEVVTNFTARRDSASLVLIQPNTRIVAAGVADASGSQDGGRLAMARYGGG